MENIIKVSVRSLVEFALKSGDIDSGFVGNMKAVEGTKGHRFIQNLRGEEYRPEVPVEYILKEGDVVLNINGRIDGIFTEEDRVIIEEIKTTETALEDIDEEYNTLHWAQAKCYGYIYGIQNTLDYIDIQLTYYHRDTKEIKLFRKSFSMSELVTFFTDIVSKYIKWANMTYEWNMLRDASIREISFPFETYRKGQRELAVAVYKTIDRGNKLFAQAPTGIGKTMAAIFPSVKAIGEGKVSKIFYLTAKTIARTVAEGAFDGLRERGLRFKTITLTAKEKMCPKDKISCNPRDCEFARGYYDRIDDAIEDILAKEDFTRDVVLDYAVKHTVCPFEFSLDVSLFCDGIICDYNYAFDPRVYLKRFFTDIREDYVFLIDEAHNLVDRAREMFSSEIHKSSFLELKTGMKKEFPGLNKALNAVNSYLIKLRKECTENEDNYMIRKQAPEELLPSLRDFIDASDEVLSRHREFDLREKLLDLYFEVFGFLRISELYDERFVTYIERHGNDVGIKLFCLDPSYLLSEGMKRGKSSILFSATLSPIDYFMNILGGDGEDYRIKIGSPFSPSNLCLLLADNIGTKYNMREHTYGDVAEYIHSMTGGRRGNYIVFFPSYKYLNEVFNIFHENNPDIKTVCQNNSMTEREREEFLSSFSEENEDTLVGFAVMGGSFGEGIDLTGERLIGAAIIGVGLPQICLERDIIRDYFNEKNNMGFQYAYVYPGINKVLQASGRVIRTESDRGVVFLIDERFSNNMYKNLLPEEWRGITRVRSSKNIEKVVDEFWNKG